MAVSSQVAFCAVLLTFSILLNAEGAVVELVADPPVKFLDDEKKPKYIIAIDRDGDAAQLPPLPAMRTMQMADRTGKKYTCRVPAADQLAAKNLTSRAGQADSSAKKKQTPSEMLDELTALCFYRAEDWWTYEVCYQKHVRQFHREQAADGSTKIAVEYSLGIFNASATDANVVQVDTTPGQKDLKYVSQQYDSGDACDITGGKRSAEVRYSCGEGAKDLIVTIKEPSTCHYVMNVRTPRLCQHPKFRVEQVPVAHILCSAVPDQLKANQQAYDTGDSGSGGDAAPEAAAQSEAAEQESGGDAGATAEAADGDAAAAPEHADAGVSDAEFSGVAASETDAEPAREAASTASTDVEEVAAEGTAEVVKDSDAASQDDADRDEL